MRLKEWLAIQNIDAVEFARRVGCDTSTISRLITAPGKKNTRGPGWELMRDIKRETAGQVTPNDWLDEYEDRSGHSDNDPPGVGNSEQPEAA